MLEVCFIVVRQLKNGYFVADRLLDKEVEQQTADPVTAEIRVC